ncbi:MAG: protein kinase [Desulfosporosinus sp.]|nr:protein kinase [Desulfosporosinus sp.]
MIKEKDRTNVLNNYFKDPKKQFKIGKPISRDSKFIFHFIHKAGDYILKQFNYTLPSPPLENGHAESPNDAYARGMKDIMHALQEYYFTKCTNAVSPHFVNPLGVDMKATYSSRTNETSITIEILQEFGGNPLPTDASLAEMFGWMVQSANGLMTLHRLKIAHLDIKPANLVLGSGIVRYIDLGSAKEYKAMDEEQDTVSKIMWEYTPAFSPPEVRLRAESGHQLEKSSPESIDVYAWGTLFYALLTRKSEDKVNEEVKKFEPLTEASNAEFKQLVKKGILAEGKEEDKNEDKDEKMKMKNLIAGLIVRCMAFNPEERPNTREIVEELVKFAKARELCKDYFSTYTKKCDEMCDNMFGPAYVHSASTMQGFTLDHYI